MYVNKLATIVLATVALGLASPVESELVDRSLEKRKDCDGWACVSYFYDPNCTPGAKLGSYKPDCTGACFQYNSFNSIGISTNLFQGTGCVAYSDSNCQNAIADSGSHKGEQCMENLNGAKSMKCFYTC